MVWVSSRICWCAYVRQLGLGLLLGLDFLKRIRLTDGAENRGVFFSCYVYICVCVSPCMCVFDSVGVILTV